MYDVVNDLNLCFKVDMFSKCILSCLNIQVHVFDGRINHTGHFIPCVLSKCSLQKVGIGWSEKMYNLRKLAVTF